MNITKMSLVAALLVGSSAFAIDNVKVSGDAKLYYTTSDAGTADLFNKNGAAGQAAASLIVSADLTEGVSTGSKVTALSTLGLETQLVNGVWEATNGTKDSFIVNDLWLAATVGKTTAKIGRMELDTPLVFTEKWSIVENTFEAAVLINTDIPNTTLVGAYVGGSNGGEATNGGSVIATTSAANAVVPGTEASTFHQFYNGAYAAGVINNSFEALTVQAWYYDASSVLKTYWLQADLDAGKLGVDGLVFGAQYTAVVDAGNVFAVMAGYEMKDMFTAKVAYSQTDDTYGAGGNLAASGQSKLYTEAWWNYGYVTRTDTTSINVTIEATVAEIDFAAYGTISKQNDGPNMNEATLTASKTFGPLDATAAYVYANAAGGGAISDYSNTLQAYLTYNF